jgi:hypothetical protein
MAACDSVPPPSHTHAAILAKAGVQFGEVDSHTSTSPGDPVQFTGVVPDARHAPADALGRGHAGQRAEGAFLAGKGAWS